MTDEQIVSFTPVPGFDDVYNVEITTPARTTRVQLSEEELSRITSRIDEFLESQ